MPIYEFKCEKCGKEFEELIIQGGDPSCPGCGAGGCKRLLSMSFGAAGTKGGTGLAPKGSDKCGNSNFK